MRDLSVKRSFSGVSLLPSKIKDSYLIMPKIVMGMVDIRSLSIVVVFDNSARASQKGSEALGLSKNVKSAQLIQEALPNMVT
jgi:hypothetical protein